MSKSTDAESRLVVNLRCAAAPRGDLPRARSSRGLGLVPFADAAARQRQYFVRVTTNDSRQKSDDSAPGVPISAERRQFVADLANDEWVDRLPEAISNDAALFDEACLEWAAKTAAFVSGDTDPRELHLFVALYNWDGGLTNLRQLAANPRCEAATALLLYWRAQPRWYLQYANESEVPEHERETFALIRFLEARLLHGEYRVGRLSYDPQASGDVGSFPMRCVRTLPTVMLEPIVSDRSKR